MIAILMLYFRPIQGSGKESFNRQDFEIMLESNDKVVIGAGTVLDPETARACILAGANYIVSPGLNVETIKLCNRYRVPMLPGVMTPTEAITAMEAGADIIKIFPGNIVGPAAISSFKGPLPQGEFKRPYSAK